MWELRSTHPFGNLSKRSILLFITFVLVTCFAYIFASAPTTLAQVPNPDSNKATWSGENIVYEGHTFNKLTPVATPVPNDTLPGKERYVYIDRTTIPAKAHVLYFADNVDPPKTAVINYAVFDFTSPNVYTNRSEKAVVTMVPQPDPAAQTGPRTSCVVEGIGWIICPITNFLADAMDTFYKVLSEFLKVPPVSTNQNNVLYRMWSYMRNFANIAFVIGFLIIIYSQLTNIGLSSYGIKKLLPRLIIAAILVNVSYWICAIAIDASNIAGASLQDIFNGMRETLVGQDNQFAAPDWKGVAVTILAGGIATGAIAAAGITATTGAVYLLIPILLGVLLAVLVAILVLAARQALITILVIVSPLAMVAYLLPNTEKYFEKWRGLFATMLLMFPIFSVIFGGSQLAGTIIIQTAQGTGSIFLFLLGMAVQVAPVVITPLLIKFSGSLLGRIAGMVNNPSKGLIDRTRKWSQERADQHKARVLANPNNKYKGRLSQMSRNKDQKRRKREAWQKTHEAMADNSWHNSSAYGAIDTANREVDLVKRTIEQQHDLHWNAKVRLDPSSLEKELKLRVTTDKANSEKAKLDTIHEELKTGNVPLSGTMGQWSQLSVDSVATAQDLALGGLRKQSAERLQKSQLTNALLQNSGRIDGRNFQQYAGGVRGEQGADSALAGAVASERKAYGEALAESAEVLRHFNLSVDERQALVMDYNVDDMALDPEMRRKGATIVKRDAHNNERVFTISDDYAREAAVEMQIREGPVKDAIEIVKYSGSVLEPYKTTIKSAAAAAGLGKTTSFIGGTTMDLIATGAIDSKERWTGVVQDNIAKGKISPEVLVTIDVDAVSEYVRAAKVAVQQGNVNHMADDPELRAAFGKQLEEFKKHARTALDPNNPNYSGRVKDNVRRKLNDLLKLDEYVEKP